MTEKIYDYFEKNIRQQTFMLGVLKRRIHTVGTIRLLVVLACAATFYFCAFPTWIVRIVIFVLFAVPFVMLILYHNRLFVRRTDCEVLMAYNREELQAMNYDCSAFDGAPEMHSMEHAFAQDLDLFGSHSLFQSMNRTVTFLGKKRLAAWLKNPLTEKQTILQRQEAVRELAGQPDYFQRFYLQGKRKQGRNDDVRNLERLRDDAKFFSENRIWRILVWIVPALWGVLIMGNVLGVVAERWLGIYLVIVLMVAYWRVKDVQRLYASVDKIEHILESYSDLMREIEVRDFRSELLLGIRYQFLRNNRKASDSLKNLSRHIGALNQRFSLAGVIFNLLFLWDTRQAIALEHWKTQHHDDMVNWLDALADFDAISSLGNYAFTHPDFVYPEITEHYFRLQGEDLGHPLLSRKVCVKNPIDIPENPWFLIITGANMAGKSTYLRTVGVNYLFACIGLPVCASRLTIYPARLVTSLRTSDSLAGESYFFAELKRLKMIIDRLKRGEKLFIILDEILKGTNSVDKQKGSIALIQQLIAYDACGIIATHDLALGSLASHQIKNYRFEATIQDEELSFSYKMQEGIAQNMNACFLMKKMGITV